MRDSAQVVIVGAGVMGASVAYHLAASGMRDVLLLEQAATPVSGSTARSAAGVRHQFSTPTNVLLSQYSIARLKRFREEVGGDAGLHQVGYLFVINDPASWAQYQQNAAMQRDLGVRVEVLAPDDAALLVPGLRTDDLHGATFGPDDGYCNARGVALGYLQRALDLGVRLECATTVTGIMVQHGRVTSVTTSRGEIDCEIMVNAAGAWAGYIAALAGLTVPVQPIRRCLYMTTPFPQFPEPIPLTLDVGSGFWMRKDGAGVIMGLARKDEPSGFTTDVDWSWLPTVRAASEFRCPLLREAQINRERCWGGLYEVTPDANPILGRHPDLPTYIDISGFSGHGIMHAPATGMLIAEEILDGRAHSLPIDDLRITRFAASAQVERNVF